MDTTNITLTSEQQTAIDDFFTFLISDKKEFVITGSPGTGKTFLMGYLGNKGILDKYKKTCDLVGLKAKPYTVTFTATTNKAAAVLSDKLNKPAFTIHGLLGLRVVENWETGEVKLQRTTGNLVLSNHIIFIDECSMIDSELYSYIKSLTDSTCKIVYVGDKYQLAPVREKLSPVFTKGFHTVELTIPIRNSGQQALMDICEQLKETVRTGVFKPIQTVPGVIDWYEPDEMREAVIDHFKVDSSDRRFLAYSNKMVIGYNDFIIDSRHEDKFEVGNTYVLATNLFIDSTKSSDKRQKSIPVEYEGTVESVEPEELLTCCGISFWGQKLVVNFPIFGSFNVVVARDYNEILLYLKAFAKAKDWKKYFTLKETVVDLRPKDSSTVHKAQGSTYEEVFIDLSDISRCNQPDMVARLLYVAFSRAKNRVFLCGKLKDKYGGIIV